MIEKANRDYLEARKTYMLCAFNFDHLPNYVNLVMLEEAIHNVQGTFYRVQHIRETYTLESLQPLKPPRSS